MATLIKSTTQSNAQPGMVVATTILAQNNGGAPDTLFALSDPIPATVASRTWSVIGSPGVTGLPVGSQSGPITLAGVTIPDGGSIYVTVFDTLLATATGTYTNTATVTASTFALPAPSTVNLPIYQQFDGQPDCTSTNSGDPCCPTTNTLLTDILNELRDDEDFEETICVEQGSNPAVLFWRRVTRNQDTGVVTVSLHNADGTPYAGAGVCDLASVNDRELIRSECRAVANGVGYTTGDIIQRITVLDVSGASPSVLATFYLNVSTGSPIAPPLATDLDCNPVVHTIMTGAGRVNTPGVYNAGSVLPAGSALLGISFNVVAGAPTLQGTYLPVLPIISPVPLSVGQSVSYSASENDDVLSGFTLTLGVGDVVDIFWTFRS